VNLLSGRRLCEGGLNGSFYNNKMYLKNGKEKIVQAVMRDGLYIGTNIADGYEEAGFPGVETDAAMTKVEEHTHPHTAEELSISEQEIYILWHRQFSHLGPMKLQNLHKISTLSKPIKVPVNRELCRVCALTKMKN